MQVTKVSNYSFLERLLLENYNNLNVNKINNRPFANYYLKSSSNGVKILILFLIGLIALFITAPIFIIVYRFFPDLTINLGTIIRIDLILSFLIVYVPIFTILRFFGRKLILGFVTSFIIIMTVLQVFNIYSFNQIKDSYLELINYVDTNPIAVPFLPENKMTIRNADAIKQAIDFQEPSVRDFAVEASLRYFNDTNNYAKYGNVIRYFSIFKVINHWNYVPDPKGFDYFAKASESIKLLAGDCDDHAILMAAAIKAIGGEARLVHTKGHLYPEVKIGRLSDITKIYNLIKRQLFYKESMGNQIYYRVDSEKNIWLNFDYTGKYPGAKYLDNKIIGILNL